jgi:hypothetical protein
LYRSEAFAKMLVNDFNECAAKCEASKKVCAGVNFMTKGTSGRKNPNNCKLLSAASHDIGVNNWISTSNGKGKRKGLVCHKRWADTTTTTTTTTTQSSTTTTATSTTSTDISTTKAYDRDPLATQVSAWTSDEAAARTKYGPISGWDTSTETTLSDLF